MDIRTPLILSILMALAVHPLPAEPSKFTLAATPDGGHQILLDGQPYWIKGAGGYVQLADLKAAGGNTLRTWNTANTSWSDIGKIMDEAHTLGLKVMLGLEMIPARHMDYSDAKARQTQLARLRKLVKKYRNHPALLLWGVGNELEWKQAGHAVWDGINEVALMVKEEDPNHPTALVLAGFADEKIKASAKYCPDVDILGINSYAPLPSLPAALERLGITKPYIVTEYGPSGWWELPKTTWKAVVEPTSGAKAESYRTGWLGGIADRKNCLGSFAFILGHKEEATFTLFGTHLSTGEKLAAMDVLEELWTGRPPADKAPALSDLNSSASQARIAPGSEVKVDATVSSNRPLRYTWLLATDRSYKTFSGDTVENVPAEVVREWQSDRPSTTFPAPEKPDTYRLYLYVRDNAGKAATANFPFAVRKSPFEKNLTRSREGAK